MPIVFSDNTNVVVSTDTCEHVLVKETEFWSENTKIVRHEHMNYEHWRN